MVLEKTEFVKVMVSVWNRGKYSVTTNYPFVKSSYRYPYTITQFVVIQSAALWLESGTVATVSHHALQQRLCSNRFTETAGHNIGILKYFHIRRVDSQWHRRFVALTVIIEIALLFVQGLDISYSTVVLVYRNMAYRGIVNVFIYIFRH